MKLKDSVIKLTEIGSLVAAIMLGGCHRNHNDNSNASNLIPSSTSPNGVTLPDVQVLGAATVTSTGLTTITGNLGLSPGTSITGFPPGVMTGTQHAADSTASTYQSDTLTAYNQLSGKGFDCTADITGVDLGGKTLTPGIYCSSTSIQLTGTLTLDSQGAADQVFIFKAVSSLTTASNSAVVRTDASTVAFWKVGSSATLGDSTNFVGNILVYQSITLNSLANVHGKLLAMNGSVTLIANQVSQ